MSGRRIGRVVLGTGAAVAVAVFSVAGYFLGTYQAPPVDPAWMVEGSDEIAEGAVTVRYTGTATLVFSDGETTWMTDGWFSRPGPLTLLYGQIEPDLDAIDKGLERNQVGTLAAVFPVHSHYDHAMDAPEVAKRTGALLFTNGSDNTLTFLQAKDVANPNIELLTLPRYDPVVLF